MSKPIQSVDRALSILELFTEKHTELGIQEISEQMMLSKSTIHGIIKTIEQRQYLTQNPTTKKYKLGIRLFQLGNLVEQNIDIKRVASSYIKDIFKVVNETVHLVVYEQNRAVYVDKEESGNSLRMYSQVGKTAPIYCTGVGKAILAHLAEDEIERILSTTNLKAFTDKTKVNKEEIKQDLALSRQRGYATDDEEIELGLYCVAAPIFNHSGKVVGSVSTAGPKFRFDQVKTDEAIKVVKESALQISKELGYIPTAQTMQ